MLSVKDVAIIYETLLASPGMGDTIKVSVQVPRKQVLLLARVIEMGLAARKDDPQGLLSIVDGTSIEELQVLSADLLRKAGLTEMSEKLNAFQVK